MKFLARERQLTDLEVVVEIDNIEGVIVIDEESLNNSSPRLSSEKDDTVLVDSKNAIETQLNKENAHSLS
jgi:hypothetical protein